MSAQKLVDFDQKSVGFFLRRAHPAKTAEHVAERIGAPVETVRQWLRGASKPNFCATLALVGVYGPELLAFALPSLPDWATRAMIAERRRAAMDELRRLEERLGDLGDDYEMGGAATDRMGRALGADLPTRSGADIGCGARLPNLD